MENPEEVLHSLEEFSKVRPKDIPRELEEYLCFVAKTGNPVYQWQTIKSLFREKLLNVITEFYESCPVVEIPPCPNVEIFNYDLMKNFILEKLDTFASAPFTVQRICELLTTPRKEYNRIDKYMRALEKNILVVSTTEPGRRSTENGECLVNGIEPEHLPESSNSNHDINVEEMDETSSWPRQVQMAPILFETNDENKPIETQQNVEQQTAQNNADEKLNEMTGSTIEAKNQQEQEISQETHISCSSIDADQQPYVSIEPVTLNMCNASQKTGEDQTVTSLSITALPAGVQQRRNSVERVEVAQIKSDDEQENNRILFSKDEPKLPEEMELAQPLTERILPHINCSDNAESLTDEKLNALPENISLYKEISDAEDEKNSLSMKIDIDVQLENYKNQLKNADKSDEEQHDKTQTILEPNSLKEEKWPKVKEESEQLTGVLPSTFLEENEVEDSIPSVGNAEQTLETLNESVIKPEICVEEKNAQEHCDLNTENIDTDISVGQVIKLQSSVDVDVNSQIKVVEKEHLCEEPSSSSTS